MYTWSGMCHNTIQGRLSFPVLQPYRVDAFRSLQSAPGLHALTLVSRFLAASVVRQ